jgi:hypothetical protein
LFEFRIGQSWDDAQAQVVGMQPDYSEEYFDTQIGEKGLEVFYYHINSYFKNMYPNILDSIWEDNNYENTLKFSYQEKQLSALKYESRYNITGEEIKTVSSSLMEIQESIAFLKPKEIISQLGSPEKILIDTVPGPSEWSEGNDEYIPYSIWFWYLKKGVLVEYSGFTSYTKDIEKYKFCFDNFQPTEVYISSISIYIYNVMLQANIPLKAGSEYYSFDITNIISYNPQQLAEKIVADPQYCIEIPRNFWEYEQ